MAASPKGTVTLSRADNSTVEFVCTKSQAKFLMSIYSHLGFAGASWEEVR